MVRFEHARRLCSTQHQPNTLKIIVSTLFSTGLFLVLAVSSPHVWRLAQAVAFIRLHVASARRSLPKPKKHLHLKLCECGCSVHARPKSTWNAQ